MQQQLSLFEVEHTQYGIKVEATNAEATRLARSTDPETSKKAAKKIAEKLSPTERLFIDTLSSFEYPATAQEVADRAVPIWPDTNLANAILKRDTVRKRAGELTKEKRSKSGEFIRPAMIKVAGDRDCYMTGSSASTYEVIR